jgi:hypothetical protein
LKGPSERAAFFADRPFLSKHVYALVLAVGAGSFNCAVVRDERSGSDSTLKAFAYGHLSELVDLIERERAKGKVLLRVLDQPYRMEAGRSR